jgi:hypothetical protein
MERSGKGLTEQPEWREKINKFRGIRTAQKSFTAKDADSGCEQVHA